VSSGQGRREVDEHILKLIIGVIAHTLAFTTTTTASKPLESISASYHAGGFSRDIFVGSLFAVAGIMIAHNGSSGTETILSKIAAIAALGVALFPCRCGGAMESVPFVHYTSAGVLFMVLAGFCFSFYQRVKVKTWSEAKVRGKVYVLCGSVIVLVLVVLGGDFLFDRALTHKFSRLVFYGEAFGLIAFGISWIVSSRTLPWITSTGYGDRIALMDS